MGKKYGDQLFWQFDYNHTGQMDMMEFPRLVAAFYKACGKGCPNYQDINYLMHKFDHDHNGMINYHEFKAMMHELGGHKNYNIDKLRARDIIVSHTSTMVIKAK